jgi:hypothetical protein
MPFSLDVKFILQTEAQLGVTFPLSFREKMMKQNGGVVANEWELYPFRDTSDRKRLSRTSNDIVRETAAAREYAPQTFPTNAIAIGTNGAGDQLVFLRDSSVPAMLVSGVYWWKHDTGEIQLLADDFADLLSVPDDTDE